MLPHIKSLKDLPHLFIVTLLVMGIGLGVYLAMQPQLFNKQAAEGAVIDLTFLPREMKVETGKEYEAKIAINPKGQRVTAAQLSVSYDPRVIAVVGITNGGFLPVSLRTLDDKQGNLNLIYGSTIDSQTGQAGILSVIKFKTLIPESTVIKINPPSQVSISSREGNVLEAYPKLTIESLDRTAPGEQTRYPDNLLLEQAFFASSEPVVRDFRESLEPKPERGPERVKPEFSEAFLKQLGMDIFISPIVALNEVLEEQAGKLLGK